MKCDRCGREMKRIYEHVSREDKDIQEWYCSYCKEYNYAVFMFGEWMTTTSIREKPVS